MKYVPYDYQRRALRWVKDHERCALFLDMGLGKSVITLTAIQELMDEADVTRTLVVAPKKVAESTWVAEASKWDHLDLRVSRVIGTPRQRVKALEAEADVYVVGRDSLVWLVDYYRGDPPFDCLVLDELTSFKSHSAARFKAVRSISPLFHRVIGLTGTPSPNGLADLWAQIYCLDLGERLGKSVTRFRSEYFSLHKWNNIVVRMTPLPGARETIERKLSDLCLSMQAKDYLTLPEMIVHDVPVELEDPVRRKYEEFQREEVMTFQGEHRDEPVNVIAQSAAGLMNKLQQFTSGAVYDDDKLAHVVHGEKLRALAEIVESAQSPVLVFYSFISDIDRIREALRFTGLTVRKYEGDDDLQDWNAGKIDVLLAHPASTAYGLNLQQGGHYIVWFGLTWNLELYLQANARLHRQGQQKPVQVYRLLCPGTVDEKVARALESKEGVQEALLHALKEMLSEYVKA